MLLQVHDELVLEVKSDECLQVQNMVKEIMEAAVPLSIPLQVEISIGENWYFS